MSVKEIISLLPRKQSRKFSFQAFFSKPHRFNDRFKLIAVARLVLALFPFVYLMGYQPVLDIPPARKNLALAQYLQTQSIESNKFLESFQLPHPGYISTTYSSWHPGIDIATGLGMPVKPIAKGKIIDSSYSFWGLGHTVVIEHEQGIKSLYGHMGRIYTKVGDEVTSSSIIGTVGMTGYTSGPHTHLEVIKDGSYINPQSLLPIPKSYLSSSGKK